MKPTLLHALSAAIAACAIGVAGAAIAPAPAIAFVDEPIASPVASSNPDPLLAQIADALNAEASLKGSKIAVTVDENGVVLLTGASNSQEQVARATEIAAGVAAQRVIANVIQPDRVTLLTQRPS